MNLIVGKLAGFCGGVINSINKTNELLDKYDELYCLGELVHNKQVVEELEDKGLIFIDDLSQVPYGSKVIIRAHGVPSSVYEDAFSKKIELFDLTCPKVLAIHELAKKLVEKDYFIVLIAQKDHPEAIGTISFCGINSLIVECVDDIDLLKECYEKSKIKKIAVISQTTFSVKKFNDICEVINSQFVNVDVYNTICMATSKRQEETDKLSKKVDAMIIIGGANSSNTKKLYEIAKNNNGNTFIIQTVDELVDKDFSMYRDIGVMAGASTPQKSIDDVVAYLKAVNKS